MPRFREPELPPTAPPQEPKPTSSPGLDNPDGGIGRDLPLPAPPQSEPGGVGLPTPGVDIPLPGPANPPMPQPGPGIAPPGTMPPLGMLSVMAIGGGVGAPAPREPELPPTAAPQEPKPTSSPGMDNPDGGIGRDLPLPAPPPSEPGGIGLPTPGVDIPLPGPANPPMPQPGPGIAPPGTTPPLGTLMVQPLLDAAFALPTFGAAGLCNTHRKRTAVRACSTGQADSQTSVRQSGNAGRGPEQRDATESDNMPGGMAGFTDTEVDCGNQLPTFEQAQGEPSSMAGMGRPVGANGSGTGHQVQAKGGSSEAEVHADSPGSAPELPTPPDLPPSGAGAPPLPSGTGTGVVADRKHNYDEPMTHPEQTKPVVQERAWERPAGQVDVPLQEGDRIPGQ